MNEENQHIILFDGICNLCNGAVMFVLKRDKKQIFKFAALQSDIGKKTSTQFSLPSENFDSFVYLKQGKLFLRSDAVLHVAKDLGYPWKLLFVFSVLPKFLRDKMYDLIVRKRFKYFGKRDTCMTPPPNYTERFLS